MELTYSRQGDYNLPNLLPPQESEPHLGKYAWMRRRFLKENRRVTYTNLLTSGKLNRHLMEVEQTALTRLSQVTMQMAQEQGLTEQLKAKNQMKWAGLQNNIRQAAEERILEELIYN